MTKTRIEKLKDKVDVTTKEILSLLANLESYGSECHCNRDLGTVKIIEQDGFYNEVQVYCMSCGGLVNV